MVGASSTYPASQSLKVYLKVTAKFGTAAPATIFGTELVAAFIKDIQLI